MFFSQRFAVALSGVSLVLALAMPASASAAPVRLWTELAGLPMGSSPAQLKTRLRGAKLKARKAKGKKSKGRSALEESVTFERHSPATVVYRFIEGKLYEVELAYAKKGRAKRMAAFLDKKFSKCKKKGKKRTCKTSDRVVKFTAPGGKVKLTFTSPKVLAAAKKGKKAEEPAAEEGAEEAAPAPKPPKKPAKVTEPAPLPKPVKVAEPAPEPKAEPKPEKKPEPKPEKKPEPAEEPKRHSSAKVINKRADDPALWDVLGVRRGPIYLFKTKLRGEKKAAHLVAAGFRRKNDDPLAAILTRDGDGYHLQHLGPSCGGTPDDARPVDFRFDGHADVALFTRSGGVRRVALIPSQAKFASAKFIGGRFGGRNAYRCFRVGTEVERVDFHDIDYDKSADLLLSYRLDGPVKGAFHDVYFFQGTDFYFREKRPGLPRKAGK